MSDPIRILIADDHPFVRKALTYLLESTGEMEVVAEADDGVTAVEMVKKHQPDVVLLDYNMPQMNGVEATRKILMACPQTAVLGLSMHEQGPVETAMLDAGASAFLTKGGDHQTLLSTIRELAAPNMG